MAEYRRVFRLRRAAGFLRRVSAGGQRSRLASRGAGIGLAIVKSLAEAHAGSVEAISAPGQGAIFRVRLPLRPPAESSGPG